jgi:hypothetical protein
MSNNDLIVFGDGQQALYYDEKNPSPDRDGTVMQKVLVVPSKELREKYNLTDEDLNIKTDDGRMGLWRDYPVEYMEWLNKSKNGVMLVACAFDGSRTRHMNRYDEVLEFTSKQDRIISRLRGYIATLERELEDMVTNQKEVFRRMKEVTDVISAGHEQVDEDEQV